jgi:hypothetical protein
MCSLALSTYHSRSNQIKQIVFPDILNNSVNDDVHFLHIQIYRFQFNKQLCADNELHGIINYVVGKPD